VNTSQLALAIAVIALAVSIGVPFVQWRIARKRTIANKRTLLLQQILATKSVTFVSMHELIDLLRRHKEQMETEQRAVLEAMVPSPHYSRRDKRDKTKALNVRKWCLQTNT